MKLLQRVMMLIRANIDDMLAQAEDPEHLLRQLQQDLRNQTVQVKTQVATAIAQEHKLQGRCEELTKEASQWQHKAEAAVARGDDAQARRALQQRLDTTRLLESYQRQHEEQQHLIVTMRNALKQLQAKTEETELNIELLQMRRRRAQMQQAVYETLSKNKQEQTPEHVRRAEDRVMDDEARAAAMRDEAQRDANATLDAQLTQLSKHEAVEEHLAQIKSRQQQKRGQRPQLPPPGAAKGASLRRPPASPTEPAEAHISAPPALPSGERIHPTLPPLNEQIEEVLQRRQAQFGGSLESADEPTSGNQPDPQAKPRAGKA
ncbi:MAG TPA: PspA/IM30 family protein [Ktedonobacterales bacterium]